MSDEAQATLLFGVRFFHEMDPTDPNHPFELCPGIVQTSDGPIEVEYTESGDHCTGDHAAVFICIRKSRQGSSNYEDDRPIEIDRMVTIPLAWFEALKEACRVAKVEYTEPRWWISAYYG